MQLGHTAHWSCALILFAPNEQGRPLAALRSARIEQLAAAAVAPLLSCSLLARELYRTGQIGQVSWRELAPHLNAQLSKLIHIHEYM